MNTAGLEWFGPPERNTLHPLCAVLLEYGSAWKKTWCVQRAPPFYISREARTWPLVPRLVGPTM